MLNSRYEDDDDHQAKAKRQSGQDGLFWFLCIGSILFLIYLYSTMCGDASFFMPDSSNPSFTKFDQQLLEQRQKHNLQQKAKWSWQLSQTDADLQHQPAVVQPTVQQQSHQHSDSDGDVEYEYDPYDLRATEKPSLPSNYSVQRFAYFTHPYEPTLDLEGDVMFDSLAEAVIIEGRYGEKEQAGPPFSYHLCVFKNVCVSDKGFYFHFSNRTQWDHYAAIISKCHPGGQTDFEVKPDNFCSCFHGGNRPYIMPFEIPPMIKSQLQSPEAAAGQHSPFKYMNFGSMSSSDPNAASTGGRSRDHHHFFAIQKWVNPHHIAHWAQKLLHFQASMQHFDQIKNLQWIHSSNTPTSSSAVPSEKFERNLFPPIPGFSPSADTFAAGEASSDERTPPPINGVIFQDSDSELTDHEYLFLQLSLLTALGPHNKLVQSLYMNPDLLKSTVAEDKDVLALLQAPNMLVKYHELESKGFDVKGILARVQTLIAQNPFVRNHIYFMHQLYKGAYRTDISFDSAKVAAAVASDASKDASVTPWSTCFPRVTMSPTYATFASASQDLSAWRQASYEYLGLGSADSFPRNLVPRHEGFQLAGLVSGSKNRQAIQALHELEHQHSEDHKEGALNVIAAHSNPLHHHHHSCPPRRAIFLTRHNRAILNKQTIADELRRNYRLEMEIVTIGPESSAKSQAELFASAGLIISSHSSQLINVVFSHPGACIVEIAPEFWNYDFPDYSRAAGVKYRYAFGGKISPESEYVPSKNHDLCVKHLKDNCQGDGACVIANAWGCPNPRHGPNKRKDFYADLPEVQKQIHKCIQHLNWQCYGRWTP